MHIIYFDRANKRHTLQLSTKKQVMLAISIIFGFIALFYYGYIIGINKNIEQQSQADWVESWVDTLRLQQSVITSAKSEVKLHLDAFSEQMAKLQAHIARLDALGLHLSKIAKIDSELFNFSEKLSEQDLYSDEQALNGNDTAEDVFRIFDNLSSNVRVVDNQLNLLQSFLKYQKLDQETLVKGKPIKTGYISSYYGYRNHPIKNRRVLHSGIDFVNKFGTPVLSVASGVVSWAGVRGGYGNMVEINHGDGYLTRYAHNSKLLVNVGDLINKGDPIAEMGSTGQSTGTHVHFEVWRDGQAENPITYLTKK